MAIHCQLNANQYELQTAILTLLRECPKGLPFSNFLISQFDDVMPQELAQALRTLEQNGCITFKNDGKPHSGLRDADDLSILAWQKSRQLITLEQQKTAKTGAETNYDILISADPDESQSYNNTDICITLRGRFALATDRLPKRQAERLNMTGIAQAKLYTKRCTEKAARKNHVHVPPSQYEVVMNVARAGGSLKFLMFVATHPAALWKLRQKHKAEVATRKPTHPRQNPT